MLLDGPPLPRQHPLPHLAQMALTGPLRVRQGGGDLCPGLPLGIALQQLVVLLRGPGGHQGRLLFADFTLK